MKILAISDEVVDGIYSPNIVTRFGDVDMIVSCGDLPYSYLEYIASSLNVPCLFVHGNHDCTEYTSCGVVLTVPGGWTNVDGRAVAVNGVIVGGLEGSIRYTPGAPFQYTELQMAVKAWRMTPHLLRQRVTRGRYLDILLTHAPPFGIQDGKDQPHRGFRAFLNVMARYQPRYLLHGHRHRYGLETRETRFLNTTVINVHPYYVIEW